MTRQGRTTILIFVCVMTFGCSSPTMGQVSGRVTLDGRALEGALVQFEAESGPAAAGLTGADGTYRLLTRRPGDGALLGRHAVAVTSSDPEHHPLPIPHRYTSTASSGLSAHVVPGNNVVNLELTTP